MANITDPALVRACNERIRPFAEAVLGLRAVGADDQAAINALLPSVAANATVLDGQDVSAFTGQNLHDYAGLLADLLTGSGDAGVLAALQAAKVRPLDVIVAGLSFAPGATGVALTDLIRQRVRPRCRVLRAVRYMIQNHLNVVPGLLTAYQGTDVIDDGRQAEGVTQLTVGQVQTLLAFMQSATDPATVNTAARAVAVDYGAGTPLSVSY